MANWKLYRDNVKDIQGRVNYIDPNDLLLSNQYITEKGGLGSNYYNVLKDSGDKIRHTWSPEDYCIDFDMCMEVPSRYDYASSVNDIYLLSWDGRDGHISLQSGQRFYYGVNKVTDNYRVQQEMSSNQDDDRYATVNYLTSRDIGANYQDIMNDYLSTEMLGIKSVTISYENNFCPIVKMELTDVRGLAVFSPLERSHTRVVNGVSGYDRNDIAGSFYRALFSLPYPKITMRVKGLYGAPTTYDLTFKNIENNFDSAQGSFNVTLTLIGYNYSFLTNVPAIHALLCPDAEGLFANYWNDVILKDKKYYLGDRKPISWIQLVKLVADAKVRIEKARKSTEGDGALARIQQLKNLITATTTAMEDLAEVAVAYLNDIVTVLETKEDKGGFTLLSNTDDEGTFIHDTILSSVYKNDFAPISYGLENAINQKDGFGGLDDETKKKLRVADAWKKLEEDIKKVNELKSKAKYFNNITLNVKIVSDYFTLGPSVNWRNHMNRNMNSTEFSSYFSQFDVQNGNVTEGLMANGYSTFMFECIASEDSKSHMYSSLMSKLKEIVDTSTIAISELTTDAKAEEMRILNSTIGFKPSLKNVMKLIVEHLECYFSGIYTLARSIAFQKDEGERTVEYLGLSPKYSDFRGEDIPPFPQVTEVQKGRRVLSWTGLLKSKTNHTFSESYLVDALNTAAQSGIKKLNKINKVGVPKSNYNDLGYMNNRDTLVNEIPACNMMFPFTLNDFFTGGYAFQSIPQKAFDAFTSEGNYSDIIVPIYLRFLSDCYSDVDNNNFDGITFGVVDAINFFYQFKKLITDNFVTKLKDLQKKSDLNDRIIKLLGGDAHFFFDDNKEAISEGSLWQSKIGYSGSQLLTGTTHTVDGKNTFVAIPNNADKDKDYSAYVRKTYDIDEIKDNRKDVLASKEAIFTPSIYDKDGNLVDEIPVSSASSADTYVMFNKYLFVTEDVTMFNPIVDNRSVAESYMLTNTFNLHNNPMTDSAYHLFVKDGSELDNVTYITYVTNDGNKKNKYKGVINSEEYKKDIMPTAYITTRFDNYKSKENAVYMRCALELFNYLPESSTTLDLKYDGKQSYDNVFDALFKNKRIDFSNDAFIQMCAMCWAMYFNNGVIYSLNYTDVAEVQKIWGETVTVDSSNGDVSVMSSNKIPKNRVTYAMALYYKDWVNKIYKPYEAENDEFTNNFFTTFNDLESFRKKIQDMTTEKTDMLSLKKSDAQDTIPDEVFSNAQLEFDKYGLEEFNLTRQSDKLYTEVVERFAVYPQLGGSFVDKFSSKGKSSNENIKNYFHNFINVLVELCNTERTSDSDETPVIEEKDDDKIKKEQGTTDKETDPRVSIYQATKRLWDGWMCGYRQRSNGAYVMKNWLDIDFFNKRFHFIDSFYNDVGDDILIDANIIVDTFYEFCGQQQDWSIMHYIQEVLGHSRVAFYNIQNWANLGDKDSLAKAFVPMSYYEGHNLSDPNSELDNSASNSDFICIYSYEPSHTVGTENDDFEGNFKGDGFVVSDNLKLPESVGYNINGQWKIPAFAVTYGKQYQSYFSNLQLNTKTGIQTEWGIMATMSIAKMGSDKVSDNSMYMGQDLYTVQSNQSFFAEVDMLGCCWVQPLMYFVITNVPMYRGTYIVYSVTHTIKAGTMTTHFKGYKMSRYANRFVNQGAYTLNPDLDFYNGEDGVKAQNIIASINNDCAYKVFSIDDISKEQDLILCNTLDVDSLKKYTPEWCNENSVWDLIVKKIARCANINDELSVKLVAMTIVNRFIEKYGEIASDSYYDIWQSIFETSVFKYVETGESDVNAKVKLWIYEVFDNPLDAFKNRTCEIPDKTIFALMLNGGTVEWDKRKAMQNLRSMSSFYNGERGDNIQDKLPKELDEKSISLITNFTPAGFYCCSNQSNMINMNHWDENYVLAHGVDDSSVKLNSTNTLIFTSKRNSNKPYWTPETYKDYCIKMVTNNSVLSEKTTCDNYVKLLKKSMSKTTVMQGDEFETSINAKKNILLSFQEVTHNAQLFDLLTRTPDSQGVSQGYFGTYSDIVWITSNVSDENPDAILVCLTENGGASNVHFYCGDDEDISTLSLGFTEDDVKDIKKSNISSFIQNGDISKLPKNFLTIMAKNISLSEKYEDSKYAEVYAPVFGGTTYMTDNWSKIYETLSKIRKDIDGSCVQQLEQTTNEEAIQYLYGQDFNKDGQEFFSKLDDYKNRTLIAMKGDRKLKIHPFDDKDDMVFGSFLKMEGVTSKSTLRYQWAYASSRGDNTGTCKPNFGTDIELEGKTATVLASYDGIVLSTVRIRSNAQNPYEFGNTTFIAYNVQNSEGEVLVCAYPYLADPRLKSDDTVMKGTEIGTLSSDYKDSYNTPHLHIMCFWVKAQFLNTGDFKKMIQIDDPANIQSRVFLTNSQFNFDMYDYFDFPADIFDIAQPVISGKRYCTPLV